MTTTDPLAAINTRRTPQSEPIPGTVPNSAGGYSFQVDDWTRLRRFLILGTDGGTYYIGQKELTKDNAACLFRCIAADGPTTVDEIVDVSQAGRAPRNDQAIFALAACAGAVDPATRRAALAALPKVCRIGTHLFQFCQYVEQFRGWGRGLREAVAKWYIDHPNDVHPDAQDEGREFNLELQLVKYQQRDGWSHRDVLRLAKPRPIRGSAADSALAWATGKTPQGFISPYLSTIDRLPTMTDAELIAAIGEYRLPWEVIPSEKLRSVDVWFALLPGMGLTALVRNLGRMTANGTLAAGNEATRIVCTRLGDQTGITRSRIHPMQILFALRTYTAGHGEKGKLTWQPVPRIVDALNDAFHLAFGNVQPSGKRNLLAIDVSGSMGSPIAGSSLTCREGAVAMALVTLAVEPDSAVMAFTDGFVPLDLSPKQRLDSAMNTVAAHRWSGDRTDCSMPMVWALQHKAAVDLFTVYTDNETWAGHMHPMQALRLYREQSGIPAKLVVVSMTANSFSIADPKDAGSLDVVGFDASTPNLISDFAAGRV